MLLWLWYRPAAAAPIQPLAWELQCAMGEALKRNRRIGRKKKKKNPPPLSDPSKPMTPGHSSDSNKLHKSVTTMMMFKLQHQLQESPVASLLGLVPSTSEFLKVLRSKWDF